MMLLPLSEILVTVLWVHVISGQSQGEYDESHDWMEGGLPNCCLRCNRIDRSASTFCEITCKGKVMSRKHRRGGGIIRIKTCSLII